MTNVFSLLTRLMVYMLVVGSATLVGLAFFDPQALGMRLRPVSNLMGVWSVGVGSAAVSIWIARKIYIQVKRRNFPDYELTKAMLLYLRKHHVLLGWATIVSATAHGLYYLTQYPHHRGAVYTGVVAWAALAALVSVGVWLDHRVKLRVGAKRVRLWHFALASVFIVAAVIHL